METYPQLVNSLTKEDGVLSINEKDLNKVYNDQLKKLQTAQNMSIVQQIRTYQASSDAAIEDFANENQYFDPKKTGNRGISTLALNQVVQEFNNGSRSIEEACGALGLDVNKNGDDLTSLAEKVQANTVATENLTSAMGEDLNYTNYANADVDINALYDQVYKELNEKYGEGKHAGVYPDRFSG